MSVVIKPIDAVLLIKLAIDKIHKRINLFYVRNGHFKQQRKSHYYWQVGILTQILCHLLLTFTIGTDCHNPKLIWNHFPFPNMIGQFCVTPVTYW